MWTQARTGHNGKWQFNISHKVHETESVNINNESFIFFRHSLTLKINICWVNPKVRLTNYVGLTTQFLCWRNNVFVKWLQQVFFSKSFNTINNWVYDLHIYFFWVDFKYIKVVITQKKCWCNTKINDAIAQYLDYKTVLYKHIFSRRFFLGWRFFA
jgi:hypothetical protein